MVYEPDLEARVIAWNRAERFGARATRPLVTSRHEARRQERVADPATAILDEAEEQASVEELWGRLSPDTVERINEFVHIRMEVYVKAAQTIAEIVASVSKDLDAFARKFLTEALGGHPAGSSVLPLERTPFLLRVPLLEPESGSPIDHLRHGRAALCPRHGPTIGGLCRTCARGR